MTRHTHWEHVYRTKAPGDVSWYQPVPEISVALIAASGIEKNDSIIDVGGGASTLVDALLAAEYSCLAVLDLSAAALAHPRARLGVRANDVEWFVADVTGFDPPHRFGLWHDRAVFHFLTDPADRRAYVATLHRTLEPGGTVIIATFALDGPAKCSGLEVLRYDETLLQAELGPAFVLRETRHEVHLTPWKSSQSFLYVRGEWHPGAAPATFSRHP